MNLFGRKKSFRGGVHPPGKKEFSRAAPIEILPPPDKVMLATLQNVGQPCLPIVKPRQKVVYGEKIGEGKAFVSASLHTPIAGVVQRMKTMTFPNGRHLPVMIVKAEGEQVDGKELVSEILGGEWPKDCMRLYEPMYIHEAISDAGIVGLGGAAFPTHIKITHESKQPINTLIINGCECEPYLTSDDRLMMDAPGPIISGTLLAARALGVKKMIIGVEDNKPRAIKALRKEAADTDIRIIALKTKYPQGSEKQLIGALTGKEILPGKLPGDVGVAINNVGTIAAVARAVARGKPLTHRVISVTGEGVVQPKNILTPIGVSVKTLIDFCGGLKPDAARVIAGGPMMGFAFTDLNTPVTKGTSGITVLTENEVRKEQETGCLRCGRCVDACPMYLVPTKLALASRYKALQVAEDYNIRACFECGSCAFICPAQIPLVQLIRSGKMYLAAKDRKAA